MVTHLYMSIVTLVYYHTHFMSFIPFIFILHVSNMEHIKKTLYGNTTDVQQVGLWATVNRNQPDGSNLTGGGPSWSSSGCDLSGPTVPTRPMESYKAIMLALHASANLMKATF